MVIVAVIAAVVVAVAAIVAVGVTDRAMAQEQE